MNEAIIEDLRVLVQQAPENSVLLYTVSAAGNKYGVPRDRPEDFRRLFGPVVPDDLSIRACRDDRLQTTLAEFGMQFLVSVAADANRPGGFKPAFQVAYKDGSPMVTIGGVLPSVNQVEDVEAILGSEDWGGIIGDLITAPHLTIRESASIQALLPSTANISREQIRELGFDLTEDEIMIFQKFYKQYPSFAQVVF